ncbi:hypothetical protein FLAG1_04364 [Fusarium langsethiae]|uniref:Uncharacterized protein n=1 Tax=Fusarium langsethiae TaxID=179993 RepID=A0A0M9EYX6_FUSLA|nr:hypothetical protein FLAG1_04364 [Fusarium langsethiae]GKU05340.1 unnamed protein product [Fusarium langsethiae]GKU11699.1 unnamed protein product [Fusarium langsethiae]
MARLPRAEKLPLAARKDIRDSWENRKGDFEEMLSNELGQPWTIVVDPWALHPYAQGTWCESSIGSAIVRYVEDASIQLRDFVNRNGDEVRDEINEICSGHVLTIDYDDTDTVSYCGVKVSSEGQLVILFSKNNLGTNTYDAANSQNLTKALNGAPSPRPMNFIARTSIRDGYNNSIGQIQEKLKDMLKQDISLVPNFEANFKKLNGSSDADSGWERNFGNVHLAYFDGLVTQLEYGKFGEDDMLQEGLLEAMDKRAVHIRIVDQTKRSYNEAVIEDGILYLQTTPTNFAVNISQVASDIIDIL